VAAGRAAVERGGPVVVRTGDLPAGLGGPHRATQWLLAVPDHDRDPAAVVFAARPLSLRFTATEVTRVCALLQVFRELAVTRAL
jgi:hypothetical protein